MKAVLINSTERTVTDVEYSGNWKDIGPLLGCRLFTVVGGLPDGDDLYCDDEGLLTANEDTTYFMMPWYPAPLVGNALILGVDDEGETIPANHDADFYRSQIDFMNSRAVWLWKELHDSSWPSSQVITYGTHPSL